MPLDLVVRNGTPPSCREPPTILLAGSAFSAVANPTLHRSGLVGEARRSGARALRI